MCSIILIHRVLTDTPLLIGANRDEEKSRPCSGPERSKQGEREILAPKDLRAGGTWLGVNDAGLFVGITNRFGAPRENNRRSRGEIPLLALAHQTPEQAVEALLKEGAASFSAYHLVLANHASARILWSDGTNLHHESLDPGIHVITESSYGAGTKDRESYVQDRLATMFKNNELNGDHLQALLGDKRDPSFFGLCVDVPEINYATLSSTVFSESQGGKRQLLYTGTPPDQPQWEDLSHLIPVAPF